MNHVEIPLEKAACLQPMMESALKPFIVNLEHLLKRIGVMMMMTASKSTKDRLNDSSMLIGMFADCMGQLLTAVITRSHIDCVNSVYHELPADLSAIVAALAYPRDEILRDTAHHLSVVEKLQPHQVDTGTNELLDHLSEMV